MKLRVRLIRKVNAHFSVKLKQLDVRFLRCNFKSNLRDDMLHSGRPFRLYLPIDMQNLVQNFNENIRGRSKHLSNLCKQ